ncbi:MAG: ABC transporter ATP-binding protein [Saccharofermentans sp.]|nr:ABC transporter ATP-binding protein [Saccharofermentans sp.]
MLIELKGLSAGYGKQTILKNIDLKIEAGEKVFIGGANGCGKTTLLRVISGLIPYTGSALINGREIRDYKRKDLSRLISLMPQQSRMYFAYKVREAVALGRYPHTNIWGNEKDSKADPVTDAMRSCGVLDLQDRYMNELSGGQLQRVMLAMCFCQETPVILLDEPASNLDIRYNAEIEEHINIWAKGSTSTPSGTIGNTPIAVFHDLTQALRFSTRAILLKGGEVFYDGDMQQAVRSGKAEYVYDFDIAGYKREEQKLWNFVQPDK